MSPDRRQQPGRRIEDLTVRELRAEQVRETATLNAIASAAVTKLAQTTVELVCADRRIRELELELLRVRQGSPADVLSFYRGSVKRRVLELVRSGELESA